MDDHRSLQNVAERLSVLERKLEFLVGREKEKRIREFRSAYRDFLTEGLVCVQADEEDLRSAGVDTTLMSTVFDFDEPGARLGDQPDKLWEITGDGCGMVYGYQWGEGIEAEVKHRRFYLDPEQAVKVNPIRARKYLDKGGSVEEAELMQSGWRFDRNFIAAVRFGAAVRAEAKARDAALSGEKAVGDDDTGKPETKPGTEAATRAQLDFVGAVAAYLGLLNFAYLERRLASISAFLILTALAVIIGESLHDALVLGLVGWVGMSLQMWWRQRKPEKRMQQVIEEAGNAAGVEGMGRVADVFVAPLGYSMARKSGESEGR